MIRRDKTLKRTSGEEKALAAGGLLERSNRITHQTKKKKLFELMETGIRRKVVVRRLPPELAEEDFKSLITKSIGDVSFFVYYPGKIR